MRTTIGNYSDPFKSTQKDSEFRGFGSGRGDQTPLGRRIVDQNSCNLEAGKLEHHNSDSRMHNHYKESQRQSS